MAAGWRFGSVEFDEVAGKLRVADRPVELDRSSRAILALLLRNARSEVGKERLLEAGWPNRIVHENSLAKAIGRLREALGDEGAKLATIYGVGYRLDVDVAPIGPSSAAAGGDAAAAGEAGPSAARPWYRRRAFHVAAVGLLALAALALAMPAIRSQADSAAEAEFRRTPPVIGDAPDAIGRVLWVDDHPQNNIYEKRFFEDHRIAVHNVTSSADAIKLLSMYSYRVVISDMGRGEDRLAGIRLTEQMRRRDIATPVVIYTLRPNGAEAQEAQRQLVAEAGAQGLALTPEEIRTVVLRMFGNPKRRPG